MGYPRQPVEHNIVRLGDFAQTFQNLPPLLARFVKTAVKTLDRLFRRHNQHIDLRIVVAAFADFVQTVAHFAHQRGAAFRMLQQIINQIRIAHDHPNIAQYFKQHPRRTSSFPLTAQVLQNLPRPVAQQSDDDFAVGVGSIVIGNFPNTLRGGSRGHGVSVFGCFYLSVVRTVGCRQILKGNNVV